jgi:ankyrin repeat protein
MMHFTPRPELPIVALDLAVQHQRLDVIHVLLENGADVNACRDDGNTVLLYAVKVKLPEMIQVVLEHGANMNVCDANGDTVLSYALKNKLPEVIQMALAQTERARRLFIVLLGSVTARHSKYLCDMVQM